MKPAKHIFKILLLLVTLFTLSCSNEEVSITPNQINTPVQTPTDEEDSGSTIQEMIIGNWEETNVTHDGVVSNSQIICNNEREQFRFQTTSGFTERSFDDYCEEVLESGTYTINSSELVLTFSGQSSDVYQIEELNETELVISFNDGGIVVEETYIKI